MTANDAINYKKKLEKIVSGLSPGTRPKLLLHSCCAPCSSYCLIYLLPYFDITCFFYNPNITGKEEYEKRYANLVRLCGILNEEFDPAARDGLPIEVTDGRGDGEFFLKNVSEGGLASCPEGGERCTMCFRMRLEKTFKEAISGGYDYFSTTLTISPHKNARLINSIGYELAKESGVMWLPSDFKKNDGFKESVRLSEKYGLYRQDYCGCEFSKRPD